jgi:DNA end-binding protein Ku
VRSIKEIDIPVMDVKGSRAEARAPVDRAAVEQQVRPTEYKDDVTRRVQAAIQKKVEGQEITVSEAPERSAADPSISWKRCARVWKRGRRPAQDAASKAARMRASRQARTPAAPAARKSAKK